MLAMPGEFRKIGLAGAFQAWCIGSRRFREEGLGAIARES